MTCCRRFQQPHTLFSHLSTLLLSDHMNFSFRHTHVTVVCECGACFLLFSHQRDVKSMKWKNIHHPGQHCVCVCEAREGEMCQTRCQRRVIKLMSSVILWYKRFMFATTLYSTPYVWRAGCPGLQQATFVAFIKASNPACLNLNFINCPVELSSLSYKINLPLNFVHMESSKGSIILISTELVPITSVDNEIHISWLSLSLFCV